MEKKKKILEKKELHKKKIFEDRKKVFEDRRFVEKSSVRSEQIKPEEERSARSFRSMRKENADKEVGVTTKSLTVAKKISSEMKIYGVNACSAAFARRPQDIVRVYIESNKVKHFSKMLKQCAEKKIAYKVIPQEELNKVTDTTHNEGVCLIMKKKEVMNFKKFLSKIPSHSKHSCVVALENVQNPHNIGATLRVCANFAVDAMLLYEPQLTQSGAVYRTAEGGAEWVQILETGELLKAIEEFKKQGFKVFGTSSHGGKSLAISKFSEKCVILFGSESDGLSPSLLKVCDQIIYIPQSGRVESLNVACAASVILYEYYKNVQA